MVQSVEVKAPLLLADALGTFKVITAAVVPPATVLVRSVPVLPKVKAATEVTVPPPPPPEGVAIHDKTPEAFDSSI